MRLLTNDEIANGSFDSDTVLSLQKWIRELEAECQLHTKGNIKLQEQRDALRAENQRLREAARHFLETISLSQRDIMAERDALDKMAALLEGE